MSVLFKNKLLYKEWGKSIITKHEGLNRTQPFGTHIPPIWNYIPLRSPWLLFYTFAYPHVNNFTWMGIALTDDVISHN